MPLRPPISQATSRRGPILSTSWLKQPARIALEFKNPKPLIILATWRPHISVPQPSLWLTVYGLGSPWSAYLVSILFYSGPVLLSSDVRGARKRHPYIHRNIGISLWPPDSRVEVRDYCQDYRGRSGVHLGRRSDSVRRAPRFNEFPDGSTECSQELINGF